MKDTYHGILLDLEFEEEKFIEKNFSIFAQKKSSDNEWILYGVEFDSNSVDEKIATIQKAMKTDEPYYAHLYSNEKMIVIFKEKVFHVSPHISSWDEIIKYGASLNIPEEQLDFWPNRFQDERHYFKKEHFLKIPQK